MVGREGTRGTRGGSGGYCPCRRWRWRSRCPCHPCSRCSCCTCSRCPRPLPLPLLLLACPHSFVTPRDRLYLPPLIRSCRPLFALAWPALDGPLFVVVGCYAPGTLPLLLLLPPPVVLSSLPLPLPLRIWPCCLPGSCAPALSFYLWYLTCNRTVSNLLFILYLPFYLGFNIPTKQMND